MTIARFASVASLLLIMPGCSLLHSAGDLLFKSAEDLRERELQQVAKDWCLTIRASQVLPIYPLTEDLEVGDLFLVTRTLDEQDDEWQERGYLSFDRHVGRLAGLDFAGFYGGSWGIGSHTDTPHHWQFPDPPRTQKPYTDWWLAPGAFFPTYTFSVSKGSGAQVAIPVQAVPVGLSLMSSQAATGTVALSDAHTYGLSLDQLLFRVQQWAERPENRDLLDAARPRPGSGSERPTAWLRVVSRVYVIGSLDVSLVNTDTAALGLDVGADAPEIKLLEAAGGDAQAYQKALDAVNASLGGAGPAPAPAGTPSAPADPEPDPAGGTPVTPAPSGAMRLTHATRRSITAKETFDRPLIVGYLGFDFPLLEAGGLGAPKTTSSVVSMEPPAAEGAELARFTDEQRALSVEKALVARRAAARPDQAVAIFERAAELLGPDFLAAYRQRLAGGAADWEAARDAFTAATGQLPMLATSAAAGMRPADAQRRVAEALQQAQREVLTAAGAP